MAEMMNPQQMLNNILSNSQVMNNPIVKNAYALAQRGNTAELQKLAENIAKEKGINLEQIKKNLMH